MRKRRDPQVNVESTEIPSTEEQELVEPEVNVRKQQNPQVNEESTEVSFTEEHELGEIEVNVGKQQTKKTFKGA